MKSLKPFFSFFISLIILSFIISCNDDSLPDVEADFIADKTMILAGESVTFTDLSTGNPNNWAWEFEGGLPGTSAIQNPTIIFSTPGSYLVQLTSSNPDHADSELKTDYIQVISQVNALFSINDTIFNQGTQIELTDLSEGEPTEWVWEFEGGTPATSNEPNPEVSYLSPGVYTVKLTVSNSLSTSIQTQQVISMPSEGLVAHYPFNGDANDETENGNHGLVFGGVEATTDRFGTSNAAFNFDGFNDYIRIQHAPEIDLDGYSESYSFSLWFSTPDPVITSAMSCRLIEKWDANNATPYPITIQLFNDSLRSIIYDARNLNGPTRIVSPGNFINEWYHLVVINDIENDLVLTYINGELITSVENKTTGSTRNNDDYLIGDNRNFNRGYSGKIDDIRIYKKALDENEIDILYVGR